MDWSAILMSAGISEPPGRPQAVAAAHERIANRRAAAGKSRPPSRGASTALNANPRSPET